MGTQSFASLAEFINWLIRSDAHLDGRAPPHWFRGHPHRGLPLRPSVLREPYVSLTGLKSPDEDAAAGRRPPESAEIAINQQFRRESASLLTPRPDIVELYFIARHHGLPTRLLDWTINGLAALFFTAISNPQDDGEVIAITPSWQLTTDDARDPRVAQLDGGPFPQRHELVTHAVGYLFGEGQRPDLPMILPVLPDLASTRMLQQGSCFTFHLPGTEDIAESAVHRFVIPKEQKPALLRDLRTVGVTWSTLFPDLDHLCLEIRSRWCSPT